MTDNEHIRYMNSMWHKIDLEEQRIEKKMAQKLLNRRRMRKSLGLISGGLIGLIVVGYIILGSFTDLIYLVGFYLMISGYYLENGYKQRREHNVY